MCVCGCVGRELRRMVHTLIIEPPSQNEEVLLYSPCGSVAGKAWLGFCSLRMPVLDLLYRLVSTTTVPSS